MSKGIERKKHVVVSKEQKLRILEHYEILSQTMKKNLAARSLGVNYHNIQDWKKELKKSLRRNESPQALQDQKN